MDFPLSHLEATDPEIAEAVRGEIHRQRTTLELIASENFTSRAVLEAAGTVLTNKYAEGYPGRRYYGGCHYIDVVESLAIERAKALFGAEHANVQPHSGSQANMAVYMTVLKPGDTYMGMNLSAGGHLTHGHPLNFSGFLYNVVAYGVDRETETIDYEEVRRLAREHKPKMITVGASAYPRIIDFVRFREICDEVGALLFVDMAHIAGLVAAGEHPSPVPDADFVTTTTHKTLRGPRAGLILCKKQYAEGKIGEPNIDRTVLPGTQGGPLCHIIAAKAVCLKEAMSEAFKEYQRQIRRNARALAEGLKARGWRLVSGGTDNHLMLVDVSREGIGGKEAETVLDEVGVTVNKNAIPFDTRRPLDPSGVRLGTPAVTTRGMKEAEMDEIADTINAALRHRSDETTKAQLKKRVLALCERFPLYG